MCNTCVSWPQHQQQNFDAPKESDASSRDSSAGQHAIVDDLQMNDDNEKVVVFVL
jgi:hypothetical protein